MFLCTWASSLLLNTMNEWIIMLVLHSCRLCLGLLGYCVLYVVTCNIHPNTHAWVLGSSLRHNVTRTQPDNRCFYLQSRRKNVDSSSVDVCILGAQPHYAVQTLSNTSRERTSVLQSLKTCLSVDWPQAAACVVLRSYSLTCVVEDWRPFCDNFKHSATVCVLQLTTSDQTLLTYNVRNLCYAACSCSTDVRLRHDTHQLVGFVTSLLAY